jgi:hypothetical protein
LDGLALFDRVSQDGWISSMADIPPDADITPHTVVSFVSRNLVHWIYTRFSSQHATANGDYSESTATLSTNVRSPHAIEWTITL